MKSFFDCDSRVINVDITVVVFQFGDNINHPSATKIRAVFFEGQPHHQGLGTLNRGLLAVEHRHLFGMDVQTNHFVVLRQQQAVRKSNATGTDNGDFHCEPASTEFISTFKASISA